MPPGGGLYGDVASVVLMETQADGVIMIILNGRRGSGFSVAVAEELILDVPEALRRLADDIDRDLGAGKLQ